MAAVAMPSDAPTTNGAAGHLRPLKDGACSVQSCASRNLVVYITAYNVRGIVRIQSEEGR